MDFEGKVLLEEKQDVSVAPLTSKVYVDWPFLKLTQAGASDLSTVFVVAELMAGGTPISRNLTYLAPLKEVHLKPATLKVETTGANGKIRIRVTFAGAGAQRVCVVRESRCEGVGQLLRCAAGGDSGGNGGDEGVAR